MSRQHRTGPKGTAAAVGAGAALEKNKSFATWIWDAACSIRGARDAPKYKELQKILEKLGVGA